MKTLGDAWDWYRKNRELLSLMGRLGRRYWDNFPEPMANDDHIREREGDEIEKSANSVLSELDDLAVGRKTVNVTPSEAFERMQAFLTLIGHVETSATAEP